MILSAEQHETLHRWLPTILVVAGIWLAARGISKLFWMAFGLAWAFHWTPGLSQSMPKLFTWWL